MKGIRRPALFLAIITTGALALSLLGTIIPFSDSARAAATITDPTTGYDAKADSFIYYRFMYRCYDQSDVGSTNLDGVKNGRWFDRLGPNVEGNLGYLKPSDGTANCDGDNGGSVTDANTALGFKDNLDAFCSIQPAAKSNQGDSKSSCLEGNGGFDLAGGTTQQTKDFSSAVQALHPGDGTYTDANVPGYVLYAVMRKSLEQMCGGGTALTSENALSSDGAAGVTVSYVDPQTGTVYPKVIYKYGSGKDDGSNPPDLYNKYDGGNRDGGNCRDFGNGGKNSLQQYAASFSTKVINDWNAQVSAYFKDSFQVTAALKKALCGAKPSARCVDNISVAYFSAVDRCVTSDLQDDMDVVARQTKMRACLKRILPKAYDKPIDGIVNADVNLNNNGQAPTTSDTTTCTVDGIGWIICPVMTFMGKLNDAAFKFISTLLTIDPKILANTGDTFTAWQRFRDIANVVFVIAFLIIVYSQITGGGVTNYGIKKLLPKIIISAILVNVSYYVCQLAVDISNIVGNSIYSFFENQLTTDAISKGSSSLPTWQKVTALAIASTAAVLVAVVALMSISTAAVLAFVMIILILVARKAALILLVVISPLAFVAYLLPNTEQWFKKWWKMFSTLLMVFPVVGLIFGASTLAARIVNNGGDLVTQIMALGIMAVPLFAVPIVLKGAMAATGTVGARLSNLQDRANRNALNAAKSGRLGEAKAAHDRSRQNRRFARRRGEGRLAQWGERNSDSRVGRAAQWIGTRQRAFDESSMGQKLGGTRGAALATQGMHKQFDDDVSAFKTTMSSKSNEELVAMVGNKSLSTEQRAAAAGMIMSRSHRESHLQALSSVRQQMEDAEKANDTQTMSALSSVQMQMAHDMKEKPFGLGDQSTGQLVDGSYGKEHTDENGKARRAEDVFDELKSRVGTKLSAQSLATMNPDEMRHIYEDAMNGQLSAPQLNNLASMINETRSNKQMDALVKPEARALHDQILARQAELKAQQDAAAATYGPNI